MSDGAGSVAHFRVLLLAVSFSGKLRQQCFHMPHFLGNPMAYNSMKKFHSYCTLAKIDK
jgi:hypothetical protein